MTLGAAALEVYWDTVMPSRWDKDGSYHQRQEHLDALKMELERAGYAMHLPVAIGGPEPDPEPAWPITHAFMQDDAWPNICLYVRRGAERVCGLPKWQHEAMEVQVSELTPELLAALKVLVAESIGDHIDDVRSRVMDDPDCPPNNWDHPRVIAFSNACMVITRAVRDATDPEEERKEKLHARMVAAEAEMDRINKVQAELDAERSAAAMRVAELRNEHRES